MYRSLQATQKFAGLSHQEHAGDATDMLLIIVLSLAVYRINRFIIKDTIFDKPRAAFINWALPKRGGTTVVDLITCPFCIGVWAAAAATFSTAAITTVPVPVLMWLASAAGSMIVWRIIEDD